MNQLNNFETELLESVIAIVIYIILRIAFAKAVQKIAKKSHKEHRTNLIIKYINALLNCIVLIVLIMIWGVKKENLLIALSSFATVLGVAMFAQWSILSNITSGVILFFFFPFKIGDKIIIHDKDFEMQGEIIDINAFHILLKNSNGVQMTYPNNLVLQKGISVIKDYVDDERDFFD